MLSIYFVFKPNHSLIYNTICLGYKQSILATNIMNIYNVLNLCQFQNLNVTSN